MRRNKIDRSLPHRTQGAPSVTETLRGADVYLMASSAVISSGTAVL